MKATDRIEHMFEQMLSQNKIVLEAVSDMQVTIKTLATQQSLDELDQKVDLIQRAVIENRHDHNSLKNESRGSKPKSNSKR